MEKNNNFYKIGFGLGLKHGPIKKFREMLDIDNEYFSDMDIKDILNIILSVYDDLNIELPIEFIDIDMTSKKDVNFFMLGYVEGKNRNVRNRANKKYHDKIGLISKSYKIHVDIADSFSETCKKMGASIGPTLERLMTDFIEKSDE